MNPVDDEAIRSADLQWPLFVSLVSIGTPDVGIMKFIEMTGKVLREVLSDDERMRNLDLESAGVEPTTIVRINQQGDIEVRRPHKWDVIGGLLGNFEERIRRVTGFDWA